MQAAYEQFGCNDGNVFFMGIDKGSNNAAVIYYDSVFGVHFPGVSGQQGGGNAVHLLYNVQATPSVVVIRPDKLIAVKQIFPPNVNNVVDSVLQAGGILKECTTGTHKPQKEEAILIYPNPVKDMAVFHFNIDKPKEVVIIIRNTSGAIILETRKKFSGSGKHIEHINLQKEPEGLYFIQIFENEKAASTKKLVISR